MEKKAVIVAGGAGFIGSHLVEKLVKEGYYPIVIDNLSTGRLWKLADIDTDDYLMIVDDIGGLQLRTLAQIRLATVQYPMEAVFNLACPASPPAYQSDMLKTLDTCYIGTRELLQVALAFKCKFIQASTSECYGDPSISPQPESYRGNVNTLGPRACYDEGKRVAESVIWSFVEKSGLDARIARIFNTYGPLMNPDDGRVVTNFIMQGLSGEPLTVYGDGTQTRSFCYIDDMVEGLFKLMTVDIPVDPDAEVNVPVFNLGNDTEISINECANIIQDLIVDQAKLPKPAISYLELPADDPTNRRPDLTRARSILGYAPSVPHTEGFKKTLRYLMKLKEQRAQKLGV